MQSSGEENQRWPDPSRRTHLANERTYLAWWRSGLAALAVGVGVGRLVPQLAHRDVGLSMAAGFGYTFVGLFFVLYGTHRARSVRRALDRNEFSHPDSRILTLLAVVGVVLGGLTIVIVARA